MESRSVLVFAKPAIPGRVKTRLIGALSPDSVAQLQAAFLADLHERLVAHGHRTRPAWALSPGEEIPSEPRGGIRQEGEDLGERLHRAFVTAGEEAGLVAIVGSDHPDLPAARLDEAFSALRSGSDVVIGPARDGGFYLVAARPARLPRALFTAIPWSTDGVLSAILSRARGRSLRVSLLDEEEDVDTPEDLERFVLRLRRAPPEHCSRTRAVLAALGRQTVGSAVCAS